MAIKKGIAMKTFTPTAASAVTAGFGFWALVWAVLAKVDTVLQLFGFKHTHYSKRGRAWINDNKGLTLCITELINFGVHGITNPAAVTFAIGGTIFNALYIFLINPVICWREKKGNPMLQIVPKGIRRA
jgi:hypothetical protein